MDTSIPSCRLYSSIVSEIHKANQVRRRVQRSLMILLFYGSPDTPQPVTTKGQGSTTISGSPLDPFFYLYTKSYSKTRALPRAAS